MARTQDSEPVRLNRFLAMLGAASRRSCDEIIAAGRVKVDGRRVTEPGTRVIPGVNRVLLDNVPVENPPRPIVVVLNKPVGVVSTVTDPEGRPTVIDLCRKYARSRRLFPVGRLDYNTTGLILLTNDGMLCYRLTHPRYQIPRTYHVRVRGVMNERKIRGLQRLTGTSRANDRTRSAVELVRQGDHESILKITLREGRNRHVRRMCEKMGLRVTKLRRIKFGPLSIRKLPLGACRPLEKKELEQLRRMVT